MGKSKENKDRENKKRAERGNKKEYSGQQDFRQVKAMQPQM